MARRRIVALDFPSIRIEGSLFPPDYLAKVAAREAPQQKDDDYGIPHRLKLRDEAGRYYRIASGLWEDFRAGRDRAKGDRRKVTVDKFLVALSRDVLGFTDIAEAGQETIGERTYPIGRVAAGGRVPLVFASVDEDLDSPTARFGDGSRRRSPFLLAQEYLNAGSAAMWALVSNGLTVRLLRDNPSLTRPAYLEFDLERIFEEELYADFVVLWLACHSSRFGSAGTELADCPLERWRIASQEAGTRAREMLRYGVADALRILGSGFLAHPANLHLRGKIQRGELKDEQFYQQLLRLVYRLLFLFTVEERSLVFRPDADEESRTRYRLGYSLGRLRDLAGARRRFDRHADLWIGLRIALAGLAKGQPALGLPALGGLFREGQCADLDASEIHNDALLSAIAKLGYFQDGGALARVNYRDMGPEELGSIYEALLELVPQVDPAASPWRFRFAGDEGNGAITGNARKLTGSYYTPDALVQELIKSALDPVIADRVKTANDELAAILGIKVIDPACGSGHFLLAAARRLGEALAKARAGDGQPTPADYRHALRDVISHCIHGVDRNPLALELAKTALWLEAYSPDRPLGFLDHHLRCGDSLVGVLDPSIMDEGIPDEAFKPLSGDDPAVAKELSRKNAAGRKVLLAERKRRAVMEELTRYEAESAQSLDRMPEDTIEDIEAKQQAFEATRKSQHHAKAQSLADFFVAAFFTPKIEARSASTPLTDDLHRLLRDVAPRDEVAASARMEAEKAAALHWRLEFPEPFQQGGFDVLLGNPPWERIKLSEEEYFAVRAPEVAAARNKAERAKKISQLARGDPAQRAIFEAFIDAKRAAEAASVYAHDSGRYPLTGVGDVNTYALFAETFLQLLADGGRAGFIVPTGIATDDSTKAYFEKITQDGRLASLYDFENRSGIFPGVHRSYKFCLLTLGRKESAEFVCFATDVEHLADPRRRFALSGADIRLINPNTRTCPIFRSSRDAELTKSIYRRVGCIEDLSSGKEGNSWRLQIRQGLFHLTNDIRDGVVIDAAARALSVDPDLVPVCEAKLVHQYDHLYATYEEGYTTVRKTTASELESQSFKTRHRYFVSRLSLLARLASAPRFVLQAAMTARQEALSRALCVWYGSHLLNTGRGIADVEETEWNRFRSMKGAEVGAVEWIRGKEETQAYPLTESELRMLADLEPLDCVTEMLDRRAPRWVLAWRDITNATNERTVIAAILPRKAVAYTLRVLVGAEARAEDIACLVAVLNSIPLDYVARQLISGTHLSDYIFRQLPIWRPELLTAHRKFLLPRVEELTYTTPEMRAFAEDIGLGHAMHVPCSDRRAILRAELDAYVAMMYGLSRDELRYILDPGEIMGEDYPTETFRGLKNNEIARHGEYRTRKLVLDAWDRLAKGAS